MSPKTPRQFPDKRVARRTPESGQRPGRRAPAATEPSAGMAALQAQGKLTVPPRTAALSQTPAPRGKRTPPAKPSAPPELVIRELPRGAPGWMKRARRMALALESAIAAGEASGTTEACIERAWAAWELDGSSDRQIAIVAHLVQRAHSAIRETNRAELQTAYADCAEVLWHGLPPHLQKRVPFETVLTLVRELRKEADGWAAVVKATALILGWHQTSISHAAHAVRVALEDHPQSSRA